MPCKDIIVNIANYNPADTYTVTIRPLVSKYTYPNPNYTKVATGPQVLFTSLPSDIYTATVQRNCAAGGISKIVTKEVLSATCSMVTNLVISGVTGTAADADWDADTDIAFFEYNMDEVVWNRVTSNSESFTGLMAGSVYDLQVRKACTNFEKGQSTRVQFQTDIVGPAFTVRVIEKVCDGHQFMGYRLRFTLADGLASTGDKYTIEYTDYYAQTHLFSETEVLPGDTIDAVVRRIASRFETVKMYIDPAGTFASFDIISLEQKAATGLIASCIDVDLVTGYAASIV